MFGRWFMGAWCTTVVAGFATAHWLFPMSPAPYLVGAYIAIFALPFVLVGSLIGLGAQWLLGRVMGPGPGRTALLGALVVLVAALGMQAVTHTLAYVLIGAFSAAAGALLAENERIWQSAWLTIALAATIASVLAILSL